MTTPSWADDLSSQISGDEGGGISTRGGTSQATCTADTPWYNSTSKKCEKCPALFPNWNVGEKKCVLSCPTGTAADANKNCQPVTAGGSGTTGTNPGATTTGTTAGTTCTNPAFCAGLPSAAPAGTPQASPCYTECQAQAQAEQNRCADLWLRTGWALAAEGCPATITPQALTGGCGCGETTTSAAAAASCPYAPPATTTSSCPYAPPVTTTGCSCQR